MSPAIPRMNLSLNQLRAFHFAASCKSITKAADKLFITQPAVSMQIKALEEQYSVLLFTRGKTGLELTESGQQLFAITVRIFDLALKAEKYLIENGSMQQTLLRVGSTKTLVRYLLAVYIERFRQLHPEVQIQVNEGSSKEIINSVIENRNDIAIVGRLTYPDELTVIPFIQDDLVLIVSSSHALAKKKKVSLRDIDVKELILRKKGSGTRKAIDEMFRDHNMAASVAIETDNVDFIKELVKRSDGISILARMGAEKDYEKKDLKILPIIEKHKMLNIDIIIDKERTLSKSAEDFLRVLAEEEMPYVLGSKPR